MRDGVVVDEADQLVLEARTGPRRSAARRRRRRAAAPPRRAQCSSCFSLSSIAGRASQRRPFVRPSKPPTRGRPRRRRNRGRWWRCSYPSEHQRLCAGRLYHDSRRGQPLNSWAITNSLSRRIPGGDYRVLIIMLAAVGLAIGRRGSRRCRSCSANPALARQVLQPIEGFQGSLGSQFVRIDGGSASSTGDGPAAAGI